jgi:hypothetical protein
LPVCRLEIRYVIFEITHISVSGATSATSGVTGSGELVHEINKNINDF